MNNTPIENILTDDLWRKVIEDDNKILLTPYSLKTRLNNNLILVASIHSILYIILKFKFELETNPEEIFRGKVMTLTIDNETIDVYTNVIKCLMKKDDNTIVDGCCCLYNIENKSVEQIYYTMGLS